MSYARGVLLAEQVIGNNSGIALGIVITLLAAAFAGGKIWSSFQSRLGALEKAQEADNKWRQQSFSPWKSRVDRDLALIKGRLGDHTGPYRDPSAAQSRSSWPKTDDH